MRTSRGRHAANAPSSAECVGDPSLRDRMRPFLVSRPRAIHLLVVLLLVLFGVAVTTQVRATATDPLESLDEAELVGLLADLRQRETELHATRSELEQEIDELQDAATSQKAAREAAQRSAIQSQILAGMIPVTGPGMVLTVTQGDSELPASLFVTTLAELRNAGAEAIELNGIRITGRSWFGEGNGGVVLDDQLITSPFVWRALGDPPTLTAALGIRGGALAQLQAFGAGVATQEYAAMTIEVTATPDTMIWGEMVSTG